MYDLTRKGRPFIWGKEQQDSFEEIKCRLVKPPVLHMQIQQADFIYTQIPVSLKLDVCYTKYRMGNSS